MLVHLNKLPTNPSRVVVLGANGFVGKAILRELSASHINALGIEKSKINLLDERSGKDLENILENGDILIIAAARAPVKDFNMLLDNLKILRPIIHAAQKISLSHIVYISSDSVYSDSASPLIESSETNPISLHGIMHNARELIIKSEIIGPLKIPLLIARPTLIYGLEDPHNGYGPNRFSRLALNGEDIPIFGKGEELRDHVSIHDVATLIVEITRYRSSGILNIASGKTKSFKAIAEQIISLTKQPIKIIQIPRIGEMPHNGFRPFNSRATQLAFPNFEYTEISEGLSQLLQEK